MAFLVTHAATQGTTCRTTDTSTHGSASLTTELVADQRTTGRAQATADSRFGPASLARSGCAASRSGDTCTDGGTGAATELLPHHIAQRATQAAANGCTAVTGHRPLSQEKSHNQGR